ncbi:MAG: acetyl-CoA carboxylase biotin carboxylase subunit [Atribacter sp.]|uniref:biotin carboxylase n=1 Tax=Candidatus Atribacter allofermentans TaxID=1852833 RepID=A0A1V5SLQ6_9BACT|nr:acetyl-CoA carboxylase biotin carboxylase subunit [Atribacterota bacterium]OQA55428.1 MAG: Biotin carboxylase [Candidatus Atribacteria bacterium ADurb.Bin276]
MFQKVLIANRGEIALRIVRACREMDIKTVGVFSDIDRNLIHLRDVDQKVALGGNSPAESYLNIDKILKACHLTKADAVHPGYGFLSENVLFVQKLQENGIAFIGPSVDVLQKMKNKLLAKKIIHDSGVPVVPGSLEVVNTLPEAKKIASEIGFPFMLKACLGGGGRGIRVVENEKNLEEAFNSARREAKMAFGNEEIYIEKILDNARHIEVQILADRFGKTIHLGERECSLQRRRQKILEEAPSPFLNDSLREKICNAAIKAAVALGYSTCGTMEFLITDDQKFYFMELNARIQVEHPITEMVSGVDILREQIRLASGEPLQLNTNQLNQRGHAIEMRINAEDPFRNFMPTPGVIKTYETPHGPGIRIDSHCYSGYEIPSFYDSLIAKLIVWDTDRIHAIRRSREALHSFIVEGVPTTIPFHLKILQNDDFLRGIFHTRFIEDEIEDI